MNHQTVPMELPNVVHLGRKDKSLKDLHNWHTNVEAKLNYCHKQLGELIENARGASFSAAILRDRVSRLEARKQHLLQEIAAYPAN